MGSHPQRTPLGAITTDSAGAATFEGAVQPSQFAHAGTIVGTGGNSTTQWIVMVGSDQVASGIGPAPALGEVAFMPGEPFEVIVSGAPAGVALSFVFVGLYFDDPDELPMVTPSPSEGGQATQGGSTTSQLVTTTKVTNPTKGTQATITLAAPPPGLRWFLVYYVASLSQDVIGSPGSGLPALFFTDTSGTVLQEEMASSTTQPSSYRVTNPPGFLLAFAYGSAVTVDFSAAVPNCYEVIALGAFQSA